MAAEINSPDSLVIKGKPKSGVRLGKKAGFAVGSVIFFAVILIMYGIATREPANERKKNAPEQKKNVVPATAAGKKLYEGVGDGIAPAARHDMPLPSETASVPPLAAKVPMAATPPELNAPANAVPDLRESGAGVNMGGTSQASQAELQEQNAERQAAMQRKQNIELERQKAYTSDTGVKTFASGDATGARQTALAALQQQQDGTSNRLPPANDLASLAARVGGGGNNNDDPNLQGRKEAFVDKARAVPDTNTLKGTRRAAISEYEVKAGTIIPAVLLTGLNSDLPGEVIAQVSENVYDTVTGKHLCIPQGARLFGPYDSRVAYGQNGALIAWSRLIFPDGSSINLEGMGAADKEGYTGLRDEVNNHYGRLFGFAALTSLFSSAFQITQGSQPQTVNGQQTPAQVAGAEVARQFSQLGISITQKNLNIQPTIEVRPGYRFIVKVDKDMVFPTAYQNDRRVK